MHAVVTGKQAFDMATVLVHLKKDVLLGLLGIESSRALSIVVDKKNGVQHDSLNSPGRLKISASDCRPS